MFDRMVDWGYLHFITKPLFHLINWLAGWFASIGITAPFGIAILATTVLVKAAFFPLANKSYESMAKMKKLQPEMERLREQFKDDRARQQQELMELYKKQKINPMSGCLPIVLQIPVFFALYKVLFVTIDMRHAPFYGWIKDLSAPDPTSHLQSVRTAAVRGARVPARRRVADHDGHHDVGADAAEPAAARSHPAEDLQLDAGAVHVHAGVVPVGPGDLLGLEQHAVAAAAVRHHAQEQHRGAFVEEPRHREAVERRNFASSFSLERFKKTGRKAGRGRIESRQGPDLISSSICMRTW